MSKEEATQFLKKLRDDPPLLGDVLARGEDRAQRIAAMVEVAVDHGLVFTEAEMRDAFADIGLVEDAGEMSHAELESVAGGLAWNRDLVSIWESIAAGRRYIGETEKNLLPTGFVRDPREGE